MVSAHPNLRRKIINTREIVKFGKSHLLSTLHSKYPQDYVNMDTHRVMSEKLPWAEIPSPIARETFGIMGNIPPKIPPAIEERWERQRRYGFTHEPVVLQPIVIDKILVLLVDFPDKSSQVPIETIYQRFFGDYTNSLKEYYKEVSYSRYIPNGEIHGWYRAPNPSTYYTNKENGFGKYPNSAEKLVEDVVDIALRDPDIDWSSFDQNDNGYIDNLIVVHSGAEAAWTGDINDFWAHVWIIPEPKMIKGRYVWIYAMTAEYLGRPDFPIDSPENQVIGGDCHEHGHQLGLPDLYDYTDQSNGVGVYSLMGAGSWGNKGITPIHLDAWSKYVLGFTDPIIDPIGTVYIDNAEQNSTNIIYTTADPKEYFMVENRQKTLYDTYLPSQGLFVWRVNENQIDNQTYNNDKNCYLVGLLQADGLKDLENRANLGDLGDSYPGISNNRSFGINTNPKSELCDMTILDILINNISDSADTISFDSAIPGPSAPTNQKLQPPPGTYEQTYSGCIGINITQQGPAITVEEMSINGVIPDFMTCGCYPSPCTPPEYCNGTISCPGGTCTAMITWANFGNVDGIFTPQITIDGGDPIMGEPPTVTAPAQVDITPGTVIQTFYLPIPPGNHALCINTGAITSPT